ncbi:MAG TPA: cupin domain-containing protein [Kofleriaceae bacterium]|nr:cupin domain-containing protein [Kofleriaceae bacterium]
MPHKTAVIVRAADLDRAEIPFVQRLNPRSRFSEVWLTKLAGLQRIGLSRARIPPGGESFAYHAHQAEEEWIFIVSGRARARIDGQTYDLVAGDFAAFPTPQAPHLLGNPFDEDCVYLMGGERGLVTDVLAYPDLGKSYVLVREPTRTAFHELGPAEYPFGRADQPSAAEVPRWRVLGARGCGSVIVEAALVLAEIPYDREEIDYGQPGPGRDRLLAHNPLGQVPTVILPDGMVLTESAALALHIDEQVPAAGLLPPPGDPLRRDALRWLMFLVSAVYPSFNYGDEPAWLGDLAPRVRAATDAHRLNLWRQVEGAARGPWFLGARFSALDVYLATMTRWRPGRAWFAERCPRLSAIAAALDDDPRLRALWAANF